MKKFVVAIILVLSLLSTIGFCIEYTPIDPPKGIAPIDYTIIHK